MAGDIVANKKTYLLLKAFENADETDKSRLHQLMTDACISEIDKVGAVMDIYNKLNIKQITQSAIEEYFQKALLNLESINADESRKLLLKNYFTDLLNRES